MDTLTFVIVLVPSTLAIIASIVNIVLSAKRETRRKEDVVWETAKEIVLKSLDESSFQIYNDDDIEVVANCFNSCYKSLLAVKNDALAQFLQEYRELRSSEKER